MILLREIFHIFRNSRKFLPSQENELSLREIYDLSFQILSKQYPNEYVFKNFIANKIFLGKHSFKYGDDVIGVSCWDE